MESSLSEAPALPLEDALQRIVAAVDEVLTAVVTNPPGMGARVEFVCRVHEDVTVPLALFAPTGVVTVAMLDSMIVVLKRHTMQTLIFD